MLAHVCPRARSLDARPMPTPFPPFLPFLRFFRFSFDATAGQLIDQRQGQGPEGTASADGQAVVGGNGRDRLHTCSSHTSLQALFELFAEVSLSLSCSHTPCPSVPPSLLSLISDETQTARPPDHAQVGFHLVVCIDEEGRCTVSAHPIPLQGPVYLYHIPRTCTWCPALVRPGPLRGLWQCPDHLALPLASRPYPHLPLPHNPFCLRLMLIAGCHFCPRSGRLLPLLKLAWIRDSSQSWMCRQSSESA